jgi:nucleoside-diphosphate-sugar epimerase
MKKVLVTGGGGFVGSALVNRLVSMGVPVVVLGRNFYPGLGNPLIEQCRGDIRDPDTLVLASRGCDTVFHVAAKAGVWGRREDYFSINCDGTQNVVAACRINGVANLVYTSTPSVVFNDADIENGDETLPYAAKTLCYYAQSKIIAEKMVLAANTDQLRTVALRPHLIWGPGDTQLIPRLVKRGKKGLIKQVGSGRNQVDIVYIDNVVDAHILAAQSLENDKQAAGKAYFISQGEPVNLWQWISGLYERLAIPAISKTVSFPKAYWAGMIMELVYTVFQVKSEPLMTRFVARQLAKSHWFSIAAARKELGYSPKISTAEGLDRLVEWVQAQEWFVND